jgi:hypothetical protein
MYNGLTIDMGDEDDPDAKVEEVEYVREEAHIDLYRQVTRKRTRRRQRNKEMTKTGNIGHKGEYNAIYTLDKLVAKHGVTNRANGPLNDRLLEMEELKRLADIQAEEDRIEEERKLKIKADKIQAKKDENSAFTNFVADKKTTTKQIIALRKKMEADEKKRHEDKRAVIRDRAPAAKKEHEAKAASDEKEKEDKIAEELSEFGAQGKVQYLIAR